MKSIFLLLALLPGIVCAESFTFRFEEAPAATDGYPWSDFNNLEYKITCKIDGGAYDIINTSKTNPVKFEVPEISVGQRLTCKGQTVGDGDLKPDGTFDRVPSGFSRVSYVTVKDKTAPPTAPPPVDVLKPSTPINVKLIQSF